MGCSPNHEEIDLSKAQLANYKAITLYSKVIEQAKIYKAVLNFLNELDLEINIKNYLKEISIYEIPTAILEETPLEEEGDFYGFLGRMTLVATKNTAISKKAEQELCDSQCKFYTLISKHPELKNEKNSSAIDSVITYYQDHRNEDKEEWVFWLREEIKICSLYLNDSNKKIVENTLLHQQKIKDEIGRMENLKPKDIYLNNKIFAGDLDTFKYHYTLVD